METKEVKLVSECCGAEIDERNNEGHFCTQCFAECDAITKEEWQEQNAETPNEPTD